MQCLRGENIKITRIIHSLVMGIKPFSLYTVNSKINGTPKVFVYLPIWKLHSILTVPNLLAHITYNYVIMCK